MITRTVLLTFLFNFCCVYTSLATHNRAGEITFKQISSLSIEVTITTYTKASSVAADRDSLEFFWGDNTSEFIRRNNNLTQFAANDVKINYYIAVHTYPGPAKYTMFFVDPNRVSTILNINYPNSVDIPFFLSTTFTLLNQQFQGPNNSVILLQPPLDIACAGKKFTHNPNGFDLDGDSLVYELATPLQAVNLPVPGYKLPNEISPGPNNTISINAQTGEFIWDAPVLQGEYNIAIRILEYRKGQLINTVLRDMQILVRTCLNDPPSIQSVEEICVVAGEIIELKVLANDINNGQKIKLFATGGPFAVENPAILLTPSVFTSSPINASFVWETTCDHIQKDYYQVVLRVLDNYFGDSSGLATLKTIRIKVVGPAPENIEAKSFGQDIELTWDEAYFCDEIQSNKFSGFAVYRSVISIPISQDTCAPGLENSGYTKIAIGVNQKMEGRFIYLDKNVEKGFTYCYRVVAEFSFLTASNLPFAKIEGLPSEEICVQLSRELPLITKVSVQSTDKSNGTMRISWTRPIIQSIDSISIPPPYVFDFYRGLDTMNMELIPQFSLTVTDLQAIFDTTFVDSGLNTVDHAYYYKIKMTSSAGLVGFSQASSSVYAQIAPSDQKLNIFWEANVAWSNFEYDIFRITNGIPIFIATTKVKNYEDNGLDNDLEYCYRILSKGSYNIPGLKDTLFNFSQDICAQPMDNVAPCISTLSVENPCDLIKSGLAIQELFNKLQWKNVQEICPSLSVDALGYRIYFAEDKQSDFRLIMEIDDVAIDGYTHYINDGLSGCYYITSIDSLGNESLGSNVVCIQNCPLYVLPNTFTPNQDSNNDLFKPLTNYFVEKIDLKVYNQWGNLVYTTHDPRINWTGQNLSGKDLADGVYHYTCQIYVKLVDGTIVEEKPLQGFIQILR
ncbi:MAG: gliding motility-associated C-terminal domain-containing protein [Saprospiraceae bacterium]